MSHVRSLVTFLRRLKKDGRVPQSACPKNPLFRQMVMNWGRDLFDNIDPMRTCMDKFSPDSLRLRKINDYGQSTDESDQYLTSQVTYWSDRYERQKADYDRMLASSNSGS